MFESTHETVVVKDDNFKDAAWSLVIGNSQKRMHCPGQKKKKNEKHTEINIKKSKGDFKICLLRKSSF